MVIMLIEYLDTRLKFDIKKTKCMSHEDKVLKYELKWSLSHVHFGNADNILGMISSSDGSAHNRLTTSFYNVVNPILF